jgi:hypothetical protein
MPDVYRSEDVRKIEQDEYLSKQLRGKMTDIYKGKISGKDFTISSADGKTSYRFVEISK